VEVFVLGYGGTWKMISISHDQLKRVRLSDIMKEPVDVDITKPKPKCGLYTWVEWVRTALEGPEPSHVRVLEPEKFKHNLGSSRNHPIYEEVSRLWAIALGRKETRGGLEMAAKVTPEAACAFPPDVLFNPFEQTKISHKDFEERFHELLDAIKSSCPWDAEDEHSPHNVKHELYEAGHYCQDATCKALWSQI
jgi:hypothetical protein